MFWEFCSGFKIFGGQLNFDECCAMKEGSFFFPCKEASVFLLIRCLFSSIGMVTSTPSSIFY